MSTNPRSSFASHRTLTPADRRRQGHAHTPDDDTERSLPHEIAGGNSALIGKGKGERERALAFLVAKARS